MAMPKVNNHSTAGMQTVNHDHTAGAWYPQEFNEGLSKLAAEVSDSVSDFFKEIGNSISSSVSELFEQVLGNKEVTIVDEPIEPIGANEMEMTALSPQTLAAYEYVY